MPLMFNSSKIPKEYAQLGQEKTSTEKYGALSPIKLSITSKVHMNL